MTIICWDGKSLVSDGRVTKGANLVTDKHKKIAELNIPYLDDELLAIGVAGCLSETAKVIHLLQTNKYPLDDKDIEFEVSGIIVGKKYVYELEGDSEFLIRYDKKTKLCVGSGDVSATTVLSMGYDAVRAVRETIKTNITCGGEISVWHSPS